MSNTHDNPLAKCSEILYSECMTSLRVVSAPTVPEQIAAGAVAHAPEGMTPVEWVASLFNVQLVSASERDEAQAILERRSVA
jgi:hypothetical protein